MSDNKVATQDVLPGRLLTAFGVAFGLAVMIGNTIGRTDECSREAAGRRVGGSREHLQQRGRLDPGRRRFPDER